MFQALWKTFQANCAQPVADDGETFDVAALTAAPIREEVEYGGVRVRTTATIAGARISIQVDIGFGDSYDNALAETINGLYQAKLIQRRGPWRNFEAVEFATLQWVDWSMAA